MELLKYWEILWRRRSIFFWVAGGIFLGTVLFILIYQYILFGPVYNFPVDVRVDKTDLMAEFLTDAPSDMGKFSSDNFVNNMVAVAESDAVMKRAVDKLNVKTKSGKSYPPSSFVNPNYLKIIMQRKGVKIKVLEDTDTIEIGGISSNPEEAVAIANTYAEEMMREVVNANQKLGRDAINFYQNEIPKLQQAMVAAEDTALSFRVQEHISDIDTYRTQLITIQTNMENTIYTTEQTLKKYDQRRRAFLSQIGKQPEFKKSSETYVENPQIESLKQALYGYQRTLSTDLLIYTEEHTEIKNVRAQIEATSQQLKDQILKTFGQEVKSRSTYYDTLLQELGDLEVDYVTAQVLIDIVRGQRDDLVKRLDEISRKEVEYSRLTRITDMLHTRLSTYITRLEAAKAVANLDVDNFTKFSNAVVPKESNVLKSYIYFPSKKIICLIALVIGLVFGLTAVFVVDYADDRIYLHEHIRTGIQAPLVGEVDENSSTISTLSVASALNDKLRRQIQDISSHWKLSTSDKKASVLSIGSYSKEDGKSFLSTALGLIRAEAGDKVLLIDGNSLNPALLNLLNLSSKDSGPLNSINDLKNQIVRSSNSNLSVLSLSGAAGNLDITKLISYIQELKNEYSTIIIDTPALSLSRFGAHVSKAADEIYLVTRWRNTRSIHAQQAATVLKESGNSLTGTIINRVKLLE